jgi:hypothetical protein
MKKTKKTLVTAVMIMATLVVGVLFQPAKNLEIKKAKAASQANSITTSAVSFFGGSDKDSVHAIGIVPVTKKIILGGFLTQTQNFGLTPNIIGAATTGAITMLSNTGQSVEKIVRVGSVIDDIEISPNGNIVVIGDGGLFVFDNTLSNVLWSKPLGASASLGGTDDVERGRRVDVAPNGQIGLLSNKIVYVFGPNGNQISSSTYSDTYIYDIAIDNNSYYITGFNQSTSGPCGQIQLAFVRGYNSSDSLFKWKSYGYSHDQAGVTALGEYSSSGNNCADSRGKRLKISPSDGTLVLAGRSDGGNSVFRWDSNELFKKITRVDNDYSSSPTGGAGQTSYIIKLNSNDGEAQSYVIHTARLTNSTGNTMHIEGLDVDDNGEIYVTGASSAYYQDRALQIVDGKAVGTYKSADGYVMQVSSDLTKKRYLTSFGGNLCPTEGLGIAVYKSMVVTGGESYDTCSSMLDNNAIQNANQGGTRDGYFAVFGDVSLSGCTNGGLNFPNCNTCPINQVFSLGNCVYSSNGLAPAISLNNISQNQIFQYGQSITMNYLVNDPENNIKKIEFFDQSEQKLGQIQPSISNTTHSFVWDNTNSWLPLPGKHILSAVVIDNDGFTVSSAETVIYIQDNTASSTKIAIDFGTIIKPVSSKLLGTNMFDISASNLNNTNYKNAVKYMNPSMVRIHNVDLMSNATTNGHGLMKPDPLNSTELIWDRTRINSFANSIKSLRTNGYNPEYVINLNKLDVGFDAFANTTKYANLLADFVKIVNQEENLGIKYFEITNELDDDFLGSNGCPNKLYCSKPFSELVRIFNASAIAMKAQDPTIKTGGLSYQNPFANVDAFMDGTIPQGTLDFFSYHRYDSSGNPIKTPNSLLYNPNGLIKTTADSFRLKLDQKSPTKRIELFANEYNICWEYQCGFGGASNTSNDYMKNQTGAVFDALGYIAGMESGLDSLNTWNEKDNYYGKYASNYVKRHGGELLKILTNYKIKDLTSHTTTNDINNEGTVKSATFTTSDNKKVLMLVNRDSQAQNAKILGTAGSTYSYQKLLNKVVTSNNISTDTPETIISKGLLANVDLELQLSAYSINFYTFDNLQNSTNTTSSSSSASSLPATVQSSISSSNSSSSTATILSSSNLLSSIASSSVSQQSSSSSQSQQLSSISSSSSLVQNQLFDNIKPEFKIVDPYYCNSGVSGRVTDNEDNTKIKVKILLTKNGASQASYSFGPIIDTLGNYKLPIQGADSNSPLYVEPGMYTVNYSAKDDAGNSAVGGGEYKIEVLASCGRSGVLSVLRNFDYNGIINSDKKTPTNQSNPQLSNQSQTPYNTQNSNSGSLGLGNLYDNIQRELRKIQSQNDSFNSNSVSTYPKTPTLEDSDLVRSGGADIRQFVIMFLLILIVTTLLSYRKKYSCDITNYKK